MKQKYHFFIVLKIQIIWRKDIEGVGYLHEYCWEVFDLLLSSTKPYCLAMMIYNQQQLNHLDVKMIGPAPVLRMALKRCCLAVMLFSNNQIQTIHQMNNVYVCWNKIQL